jgi:hypothetical protein
MAEQQKTYLEQFKELLTSVGLDVYNVPVENEQTIVCLCRLRPLTQQDTTLKAAEGRLLFFIEKALKAEVENVDSWRLRLSRPWILKEDKLFFTWDFTFQGDLRRCIEKLKTINVPPAPSPSSGEVAVQSVKTTRGTIRQVRVGNLRA